MSLRKLFPTHAELTTFLETFLPPSPNHETQAREVPFLYHTVRREWYLPTEQLTSRAVFSITPTKGVYAALDRFAPRHRLPVCFLHRPFNLDRRAVKYGALVISSHKSFDQHLTVGWNTVLGDRLGLDLGVAVCIQGYKGDDDRKIGLVAPLLRPRLLSDLAGALRAEFSGNGDLFPSKAASTVAFESTDSTKDSHATVMNTDTERSVDVVAIMNAFHAEEIQRVLTAAHAAGWIKTVDSGQQILYVTGEARDYGIEAVAKVGMPAFCVGHAACEEWGIRYLAQQTRERWPGLDVVEIFEEEEPRPTKAAVGTKQSKAKTPRPDD